MSNWEDEISEQEAREFIASCMRPNKDETDIDFCRRIMADRSAGVWIMADGFEVLVDTFSASAVLQVADAEFSETGKAKFRSLDLIQKVKVAIKLCS